jgi:hypothetical protein
MKTSMISGNMNALPNNYFSTGIVSFLYNLMVGSQDSVIGIATCYGLDSLGIESPLG